MELFENRKRLCVFVRVCDNPSKCVLNTLLTAHLTVSTQDLKGQGYWCKVKDQIKVTTGPCTTTSKSQCPLRWPGQNNISTAPKSCVLKIMAIIKDQSLTRGECP